MKKPKLKLGLMIDSYQQPAWVYTSIEKIIQSDYAEILLVIVTQEPKTNGGGSKKILKNPKNWGFDLLKSIDEKIMFRSDNNACDLKDIRNLLSTKNVIATKCRKNGHGHDLEYSSVEQINRYHLDILINMGFPRLSGRIQTAAKYGIWYYSRGRNTSVQEEVVGFWEVVNSEPETTYLLYMLDPETGEEKRLYQTNGITHPYSPLRNREFYLWTAASFLHRQLKALYTEGEEKYFAQKKREFTNQHSAYDKSEHKPGNFQAAVLSLKLFSKMLSRGVEKILYQDKWSLMYDFESHGEVNKFKKVVPPPDRFWADPHILYTAGKYYIFIEEYLYEKGKGQIGVLEMDERGEIKGSYPILVKDYHLSFPYVFEWQGKYYMVPETSEKKSIDLYECLEFPHKWAFKMKLMDNVAAVDTVVFPYQDRWWLFSGIAENHGAFPNIELHAFYADDFPTNQWTPHLLNPIVSDVKRARLAGRIFLDQGKLIRPSQNCSIRYGYAFDLNEIKVLTETDYQEEMLSSFMPDWDKSVLGTHTYSREANLTMIDVFQNRWKLW